MRPPQAVEGAQAEEERLRPGDTLDPRSGVGCVAPGRPRHHLQASLHAPRGRRLTGAICLHYAGLFGEAGDGGLSWLREGLIYWQTCFEALFKAAAPQIRARRMAALGMSPRIGGFHSGGGGLPEWPSWGELGVSRAFELCTAALLASPTAQSSFFFFFEVRCILNDPVHY